MATVESLAEIETAELIISVDDGRVAGDSFKLLTPLRTLVETRLADLRVKDSADPSFSTSGKTSTVDFGQVWLATLGLSYSF